jgi:hypothetical protein
MPLLTSLSFLSFEGRPYNVAALRFGAIPLPLSTELLSQAKQVMLWNKTLSHPNDYYVRESLVFRILIFSLSNSLLLFLPQVVGGTFEITLISLPDAADVLKVT